MIKYRQEASNFKCVDFKKTIKWAYQDLTPNNSGMENIKGICGQQWMQLSTKQKRTFVGFMD